MERTIQMYGRINKEGTHPNFYGVEKYISLLKDNPDKAIFMELSVIEPNTTKHHVWYIIKMFIPAFIQGYKDKGTLITPQQALIEIVDCCPAFCKNKKGETHNVFNWDKYQPNCEMSTLELEFAIEHLHLYCLENFNIPIGNTKTI